MNILSRRSTPERLADKVTYAAHEAREHSADSIAHAGQVLREAAAASEHHLRAIGGQAQHMSEQAYHSVRDYTREHPLAVIGVTALSALIVYRMMSRRDKARRRLV